MSDPIVARYTAELGRALYAKRPISRNEVILNDRPALLLDGNPSIPQRIEALQSSSCEILRRHLFAPDPHDESLTHHPVLRVLRLMAKSETDPASALRCALCWHANAFAFGSSTALFFVASLFAHSCQPNAVYEPVEGAMQFRALRDLAEGELITISYLPAELEAQGRRQRQDRLWRDKCFRCRCVRCEAEASVVATVADAKEAEPLASLEDEVAALANANVAACTAVTSAPLAQLRERTEVLLGDQHWAHALVLLMEADLLLSEAPLSAPAVQLLKRTSAWVCTQRPHLAYALLGARLARALAKRPEDEAIRAALLAVCEAVQAVLCFPHQQRELAALASAPTKP